MPSDQTPSALSLAHHRALVEDAVAGAGDLMGELVAAAVLALRVREKAAFDIRARDAFAASAERLQREEGALRAQYPKSLLGAFSQAEHSQNVVYSLAPTLDFDQLELMDELQAEESVAIARVQQSAMLATDTSLAELNTLVCSALGLDSVRPERNPLRPRVYVDALKSTLDRVDAPESMRLQWLTGMGAALGKELSERYVQVSAQLRSQGVASASYAVPQAYNGNTDVTAASKAFGVGVTAPSADRRQPDGFGARVGDRTSPSVGDRREQNSGSLGFQGRLPAARTGTDDTLLTLDKLRRLLKGELDQTHGSETVEGFADHFSREFESESMPVDAVPTGFDATVPAALNALKEMQQLDHVVRRLEERKALRAVGSETLQADDNPVRVALQGQVKGVAQALSVEVVKLMVENIARDRRLLGPVQQLIRELEPALARLSLVDPRMFTNKQHPARVLLHEVVHNSMAYATVQETGFVGYLDVVQKAIAPLMRGGTIDDAEPFERALGRLRSGWKAAAETRAQDSARAVKILEHAEQRNVLAEKIARQIAAHPDAAVLPSLVVDFLCGPWSLVVAQARIVSGVGSDSADRYQALVGALMWSTHPQLTQNNTAKLTRLVPPLLATLREGLATIHYPTVEASAFVKSLIGLHQLVFRSSQKSPSSVAVSPDVIEKGGISIVIEEGNPWVAPDEARESNFLDLPDPSEATGATEKTSFSEVVHAGTVPTVDAPEILETTAMGVGDLSVGAWVELKVGDGWIRTQLTWASPHGTLFLFTSALGATQSMTRRSRDKLVASGNLRVISGQPVVDGALDAVAQQAMRNSLGLGAA